mmetsp:Transcript_21711/g.31689  ORF Transcript_21711/g.31689 Transcript_21711/m.31689 type:complete len:107 (+) Transcript_21711:58-378(+)
MSKSSNMDATPQHSLLQVKSSPERFLRIGSVIKVLRLQIKLQAQIKTNQFQGTDALADLIPTGSLIGSLLDELTPRTFFINENGKHLWKLVVIYDEGAPICHTTCK